jgi:hypothetical protein
VIFIDYKGIIDPKTGEPHVGHRALSGAPKSSVIVLLSPGVQGIDPKAWEAVRDHKSIGWDGKEYKGYLLEDGQIKILPNKNGKVVDWKSIPKIDLIGERGIIGRTIHPTVLESLRQYAVSRSNETEGWENVLKAVEKQLADVCTGFDGKQIDVATAQARFKQVVGG